MKQKKIKIQYRSRAMAHGYAAVPMIQLTGSWLENLGYSIGDTVIMEYDEDGIRIRPMTESEQGDLKKAELAATIRRKQKELVFLQKQIDSELSMVAESTSTYSDL